jgi:orotate phosphoribosyltransferase
VSLDVQSALPVRHGHFLLESGYHTDLWLTLDACFADPKKTTPLVSALAARLARYAVDGVCGPFAGGAFLAQAIALNLATPFFYTLPGEPLAKTGLFRAAYRFPAGLIPLLDGKRIAVVDDAIGAGSSVRATVVALENAGASPVVIGTLLALGDVGTRHFEEAKLPVIALERRPLTLWLPAECPLCARAVPVEDPVSG